MALLSINMAILLQEATLAVAAVQKKKRDQENAPCVVPGTKSKNNFSSKLVYSMKLHPGSLMENPGMAAKKFLSPKLKVTNF